LRIHIPLSIALALSASCAVPSLVGGPLGEGASDYPTITAVDTSTYPPKRMSIKLDKDAYAVLILVAPGHSASLLYPPDSTTDNRLAAGAHDIAFEVPAPLALSDSARLRRAREERARADSAFSSRSRPTSPQGPAMRPIAIDATTYLLVVTSPQPLVYKRVLDKTAGWSIPVDDMQALNSVAKQVKATITNSPRDWSAAFHVVALQPPPKK
jgi:hypothetical protein